MIDQLLQTHSRSCSLVYTHTLSDIVFSKAKLNKDVMSVLLTLRHLYMCNAANDSFTVNTIIPNFQISKFGARHWILYVLTDLLKSIMSFDIYVIYHSSYVIIWHEWQICYIMMMTYDIYVLLMYAIMVVKSSVEI